MLREAGLPRLNTRDLVMQVVMGQIAHPVGRANPYRIGNDGVPRVLPGTGGIVVNFRIGDRCVGLAGDHIEPGAALHNNSREIVGGRDGPNLALLTNACVGNLARVISGACTGAVGLVTGKHGGVNHVLVDFDTPTLARLQIGDRIQIYAYGVGLTMPDYPELTLANSSPELLRHWKPFASPDGLEVRATHLIPAAIIGSGLGKNSVWRGDFDIQLFDRRVRRRFGLGSLRFGDIVAVIGGDGRYGPSWRQGRTTIGIIVHGDSTVSGHGPGITALLTGPSHRLHIRRDPRANLAFMFGRRAFVPARQVQPLAHARTSTNEISYARPYRRALV